MNARLTLGVFLAFAALAVFAWTLRDEAPRQVGPNAPTATPGAIWEVADDGVTAVAVVGATGAYTLTRAGDGWLVDGQPAADEVEGAVQGAAKPSVLRVLGEERDPDQYGFASPTLTLTFTISDTERVLLVGDQPPTSSDYYVRTADGGPMRIVSGYDIDRLKDWLLTPPLAPTATPEATATPGEGTVEPTIEGEDAMEGDAGTPEAAATAEDEPLIVPATVAATEAATEAAPATATPGRTGTPTPDMAATPTHTPDAAATPTMTPANG